MKKLNSKLALLLSLCLVFTSVIPAYADAVTVPEYPEVQEESLTESPDVIEEELTDIKIDIEAEDAVTDPEIELIEKATPSNAESSEIIMAESLAEQGAESVLSGMLPGSDEGIVIDDINFPDENFRDYVGYVLDLDGNGVLSDDEIEEATAIYVTGKGISSLDGVEYFTALTHLDCSSNQLEQLDLSNNPVLEWLNCSLNKLTQLDVRMNTALKELYCNINQLSELDVSKNTSLTVLSCNQNNLSSLDVRNNTALKELSFAVNQISEPDLSQNTELSRLICAENHMDALDVSQNTALTYLHCVESGLSQLDVSKNTELIELYCNSNALTTLDLSNLTKLEAVECVGNQLAELKVSGCTLLDCLRCGINNLTELDVSTDTALIELECSNNQLEDLDLRGLSNLRYLFCDDNDLTELDIRETQSCKGEKNYGFFGFEDNKSTVEVSMTEGQKDFFESCFADDKRNNGVVAVVKNPEISFVYDKESYTYPDPVTITVKLNDAIAAPEKVTWYQVDKIGGVYNETGGNPLVLPATVPSSDTMWFVKIEDEGIENTEINIKEPDKGMIAVFDNQPVYQGSTVAAASPGASGSVSLSEDGLTAIIRNVHLSECDEVTNIFAKLMIYGVTEESYQLVFEGDSDFGDEEPLSEGVYSSIIGGFYSGSEVEIKSATPGIPINLKGASYDFFETGYLDETWDKITNFTINDINLTAYATGKIALSIYGTQLECRNCKISAKAVDYPGAIEIGLNNLGHEEDLEYSTFTNCTIDAETDYAEIGRIDVEGAPSPSAFNCSHNHVLFKDCNTNLKLDHTTLGECRGVYMLSGELVIDGGTLDIEVDCPLDDLDAPRTTELQVLAAAIQAVSFSAKNQARVKAAVSNVPHSSWGIIYAKDVLIENSSLDIDVLHTYEGISDQIDMYGNCTEGIYYYGDDTVPDNLFVWKGIETELPEALADVGNVVISSGSNVDIYLEGTPYEYTTCGISGRYVAVEDSDVSIEVQTHPFADSELYPGFGAAFVIYNFAEDADIELKGTAITLPSEARIQAVERESIPKTEFYTVLDENTKNIVKSVKIEKGASPQFRHTCATTAGTGSGTISPNGSVYTAENVFIDFTATPDAGSRILHWMEDGVKTAYGQSNYRLAVGTQDHTVQVVFGNNPKTDPSSEETALFTGSTGNPVTNGTWRVNADGTWSFATSQTFTNTWGFIRYMANGVPADSWFWFDKNGRMLTGWQKLYWNGKLSWYYFNEIHDGTFGACQLGGITPDGYKLGPDGAWIED